MQCAAHHLHSHLKHTLNEVTPFYLPRSQSVDLADELSGWTNHVNISGRECLNGTLSAKIKYTRSFREDAIGECLFGVSTCNSNCATTLQVSGSRVANRGPLDLLADYFYLPTDFQSTLAFKPRIENIMGDFNFYFAFDEWVQGLFLRVHFPVVSTRWKLGFCETVTTTGNNAYVPGYFECDGVPRSSLLTSFSSYAIGNAPTITEVLSTGTVAFDPLCFAKIDNCKHTKTGVADFRVILGYDFLLCDDYHVGLGILFAGPTGNRPTARYLFEPIVGNGKHWELAQTLLLITHSGEAAMKIKAWDYMLMQISRIYSKLVSVELLIYMQTIKPLYVG